MQNNKKKLPQDAKSKKSSLKDLNFDGLEQIRLTPNQQIFSDKITKSRICFSHGAAGTSKTFTACYTALKLLQKGEINKIILTKPIKESGENLGFLPGTIEDKTAPYLESFITNFQKIVGEEIVKILMEHKLIEMKPLAYMRGSTFSNCVMLFDEAQNATWDQFILYITRLGKGTKIVITGDVTQRDIEKKKVVMPDFIEMIKDVKGVETHEFKREDIVRDKILIEITDKYEKWKDEKGL